VDWYTDWIRASSMARVQGLAEIEGPDAIQTFLEAIRARFQPEWA
jgi:hypothetical protein